MDYTLEQKIDIVLRYIATDRDTEKSRLKVMAAEALQSGKTAVHNTPDIDTAILDLLREVGISAHLNGHRALVHAISLVISDPTRIRKACGLYSDVGKIVGTNSSQVEKTMRTAIESAFNKNSHGHMREVFGYTVDIAKGRPRNREFIIICVNEVLRRTGKPVIF